MVLHRDWFCRSTYWSYTETGVIEVHSGPTQRLVLFLDPKHKLVIYILVLRKDWFYSGIHGLLTGSILV